MTDLSLHLVQQRDVQPWTMEEYMAKNARLAEWNNRVRFSICIFFLFFLRTIVPSLRSSLNGD